nr:MAG TPA: hypothetical protein [Bacteriophage sp.]
MKSRKEYCICNILVLLYYKKGGVYIEWCK